jgi:solute carrier family 25, member 39/40
MMAIPMVGIYLPLYDYLVDGLRQRGAGMYAPLLAGTLARTAAGYATSPFELARTRMQAVRAVPLETHAAGYAVASASARGSAGAAMLRHLPSLQGAATTKAIGTLWTGVGATLARDVPFSALYWAMVEPIRQGILPPDGASSETEVVVANAVAGATAGALAGSITTPLDVVKTRTQLAANASATASGSVWSTLRDITKNEGVAGLFRGWSARSAKAAPACAIVLSAYEMLKFWHPGGKQQ